MKKYIVQDDGSIAVKRVKGRGRGNTAFPVPWDSPDDDFDDAESLGWRWLYDEGCRSVCDKAMFRPSASQCAIAMQKDLDGKENPRYLGRQCQSFFLTVPVWTLGGVDESYPDDDERRYTKAVSRLKAILDRGKDWEWEFQIELGSNAEDGKAPYPHAQLVVHTPRIDGSKFLKYFPYDVYCRKVSKKEAADLYCRKEATRVAGPYVSDGFVLGGKQGQREDLEARHEAVEKVKAGAKPWDLLDENPELYVDRDKLNYYHDRYMKKHYSKYTKRFNGCIYLVGSKGCGKSLWSKAYAARHGKTGFVVSDYRHPFDKYEEEQVVVFEEWRGDASISDMLKWTDRFVIQANARYANPWGVYDTVIFNSNFPMGHFYGMSSDWTAENGGAWERRSATFRVWLDPVDFDTMHFERIGGEMNVPDIPDDSVLKLIEETSEPEHVEEDLAERRRWIEAQKAAQKKSQADGDWEDEV